MERVIRAEIFPTTDNGNNNNNNTNNNKLLTPTTNVHTLLQQRINVDMYLPTMMRNIDALSSNSTTTTTTLVRIETNAEKDNDKRQRTKHKGERRVEDFFPSA